MVKKAKSVTEVFETASDTCRSWLKDALGVSLAKQTLEVHKQTLALLSAEVDGIREKVAELNMAIKNPPQNIANGNKDDEFAALVDQVAKLNMKLNKVIENRQQNTVNGNTNDEFAALVDQVADLQFRVLQMEIHTPRTPPPVSPLPPPPPKLHIPSDSARPRMRLILVILGVLLVGALLCVGINHPHSNAADNPSTSAVDVQPIFLIGTGSSPPPPSWKQQLYAYVCQLFSYTCNTLTPVMNVVYPPPSKALVVRGVNNTNRWETKIHRLFNYLWNLVLQMWNEFSPSKELVVYSDNTPPESIRYPHDVLSLKIVFDNSTFSTPILTVTPSIRYILKEVLFMEIDDPITITTPAILNVINKLLLMEQIEALPQTKAVYSPPPQETESANPKFRYRMYFCVAVAIGLILHVRIFGRIFGLVSV